MRTCGACSRTSRVIAGKRRPLASFVGTSSEIRRLVAKWTGEFQYTLDARARRHDRPVRGSSLAGGGSRTSAADGFLRSAHGQDDALLYSQGRRTGLPYDPTKQNSAVVMRKLRILALMHPELVPPSDAAEKDEQEKFVWKTEWDVCRTLGEMGHDVRPFGVQDELLPIRDAVAGVRAARRVQSARGVPRQRAVRPERGRACSSCCGCRTRGAIRAG